jgi:hypothetical protein
MSLTASKINRSIKTYENTLWVLFFVWPVASLFFAIKNFHIKPYRKFIVLFGVLYGLTFLPIPFSDGSRYAQRFEETNNYSWSEYVYDITHIYTGGGNPDVYAHTLFFVTSKFSKNARFFHMVTALIYFLVFIKLLASIYDLVRGAWGKYYLWFFLGCVFVLNLSIGINGVRYPLAFMVFALGAFKLIVTGEKKYLVIALLSPFIHFMFVYPVVFLLLFHWVPFSRNQTFLLVFLLLSLLAGTFFHTFIQNNIGFLGESYESRFADYTNEAWIEGREEHVTGWNWYVIFRHYGNHYFSLIAIFLVWFRQKKLQSDIISKKLFVFAVFMIIASFISGGMVDSISNRFNALAIIFSFIFLFYISSLNPESLMLKTLSRLYIPIFIIHVLVVFRADLYTVSPWLIFGNPVLMWLLETTGSIQELILG